MANVTIIGGTGLVGKKLAETLVLSGHRVKISTRNLKAASESFGIPVEIIEWANLEATPPPEQLFFKEPSVWVVLAGESVGGGRWTADRKKAIMDSRVLPTKQIASTIKARKEASLSVPEQILSASAVGYYGNAGQIQLDENSLVGEGFLAQVCEAWEAAWAPIETQVLKLRIGVVLSELGGALGQILTPFAWRAAGPIGSGKQWMSWIHLDDLVALIQYFIETSKPDKQAIFGALNAVAPEPVVQHEFMKTIGQFLNRSAKLPAPTAAIKMTLGEMSAVVLDSQKVYPKRLLDQFSTFKFKYATLTSAIQDILNKLSNSPHSQVYVQYQWFKQPKEKVFEFFSDEKNLERITPPWLGFKVLSKSTPEIEESTRIDYRLELHRIPFRWRTLIKQWKKGEAFVDQQLKGPYRLWNHQHLFFECQGGTLMRDTVVYELPLGAIGNLVAGRWVKKDINLIFNFRRHAILELL